LGFTGGRQQTRVSDLSGGERRRLQLTRLLMDEPNVLLLDEPTNGLDIETLTSLEDVLDGWAGTLLVVSHDRYLLERVCDKQVALLGDGRIREMPGGVEQYLELRRAQPAPRPVQSRTPAQPRTPAGDPGAQVSHPNGTRSTVGQGAGSGRSAGSDQGAGSGRSAGSAGSAPSAASTPPAHTAAELREARKDMARVEKQLARLAEREERIHAAMAQSATDHAKVLTLNGQLRAIVDEREALELEWLAAAEIVG
jgi:ABC-type multidrug transport system ATPase subunit